MRNWGEIPNDLEKILKNTGKVCDYKNNSEKSRLFTDNFLGNCGVISQTFLNNSKKSVFQIIFRKIGDNVAKKKKKIVTV